MIHVQNIIIIGNNCIDKTAMRLYEIGCNSYERMLFQYFKVTLFEKFLITYVLSTN